MCCRPSVCRLSVTLVRPTQPVEIFGNVSTPFGTLPSVDVQNFTEIAPGEPFRGWGLNARAVAKYSYVSETVQDRKYSVPVS